MPNITLALDEETRDIFFENGELALIGDSDSIVQNIRNTLLVYKDEWKGDEEHGTDYETIFEDGNVSDEEVTEIIRSAIFEEPNVQEVGEINISRKERHLNIEFSAILYNGENITAKVAI